MWKFFIYLDGDAIEIVSFTWTVDINIGFLKSFRKINNVQCTNIQDEGLADKIHQEDRDAIKQYIVGLMLGSPEQIQKQVRLVFYFYFKNKRYSLINKNLFCLQFDLVYIEPLRTKGDFKLRGKGQFFNMNWFHW